MNIHIEGCVLFVFLAVVSCQEFKQSLVDYYVDIINNHSQKSLEYEFPSDARMYEAAEKVPQEYGEFDFIVIGAGTTGCVIANRLSEVKNWKILLLEAGVYQDEDISGVPQMWTAETFSKFNWGFQSVPQKYGCQGNVGQICFIPRGKGVGGTTLINGMLMTRGNEVDFQRWSELLDDPKWNYENVLPYFKKSENFTKKNPFVPLDPSYHGYDGLLSVTEAFPPDYISLNILKAGKQLGYNVTDYNGEHQVGFTVFQTNIKDGRRFDFETAFLSTAKDRSNLEVLDQSYVTKINVCPFTKKTQSVTFTRNNKTYVARSGSEVILSAGVVSSPQILMLSGIGPEDHLESVGIPVIQNLPVGEYFRDQTFTTLMFSTNLTNQEEPLEKSVEDFLKGQGTLTKALIYDAVAWVSTVENQKSYPDVEWMFFNLSTATPFQRIMGWSNETFEAVSADVPNAISVILALLDTKSFGYIKLKSSDPFEFPLIDPNILSHEDDLEAIYRSIQQIIELTKTEAFRSMNVTLTSDRFAPCNHLEPQSKDYWFCFIKKVTSIGSHSVGTCRTGRDQRTGVVDNRLRVFGVDGLRVADASVIPNSIAAHTNAACAMVGEKVSDLIKEDHRY